jgi:hypothetical protein
MIQGITVDTSDVDRFPHRLREYERVSGKTADEVLDKQGNKLRIEIGREFRKVKWKGGKKVAQKELRARTRAGKGTKVRLKYLADDYAGSAPDTDKNGRPLNKWQKLVWQEINRRQAGTGILGISFFNKRWRFSRGERYLAENRSRKLGVLVRITKEKSSFTIEGMTPGLVTVDSKYGIVNKAKNTVSRDIETYLARKMNGKPLDALKN